MGNFWHLWHFSQIQFYQFKCPDVTLATASGQIDLAWM
jgi:hypothetical protein